LGIRIEKAVGRFYFILGNSSSETLLANLENPLFMKHRVNGRRHNQREEERKDKSANNANCQVLQKFRTGSESQSEP
jgi:hypothetical protein